MRRTQVVVWGRHLGWIFHLDPQPELTATAETVPQATVLHVHVVRHLHLTHGGDAAGLSLALPPGSAVTTTEEE
jgi:hypothetical protein